jgi:phospholipid/cholesterol/gamma-HCH transport system substrate-binding protein
VDSSRSTFVVGIVVLLGIASAIFIFSTSHQGYEYGENTYRLYALFDDVSGLNKGTRVTVAGVQVGEVHNIAIAENSPNLARVTILIEKERKLKEGMRNEKGEWINGTTITRRQASVLGDHYLELSVGINGRALVDGDEITSVVSASGLSAVMRQLERTGELFDRFQRIFVQVEGIATDVKKVTTPIANIFGGDEGTKRMDGIAENISQASRDLTAITRQVKDVTGAVNTFLKGSIVGKGDQIGQIIHNVERFSSNAARLSGEASTSVRRILGNVEVVTRDVRTLISGSRGQVESSLGTIRGTLASLTNSLDKVDTIMTNVNEITDKVNRGDGTLGRLINDDTAIIRIEELVADAGDVVKRVSRLETRVDLRSEFYFEQAALKNYLRLRLQPKEDKYYLLELIDDPRGKTNVQQVVTQTNDPSLPPVVNETAATTSQGIKFSFQFAKRWYFLTGRFGIFEGTGGLGIDMEFFDDALRLSADVFDFTENEYPRLRLLTNIEFFKHFYVSAGVDDVMNQSSMDWFVGGGIRFTDDDLKALLITAPTPSL